ncbi:MAG: Segregation and condensation protein B [Verrucomicrobiae bacterium]|nr:Segregation and condensation protein B [Verrucomicrobiae bacterium]
MTLELKKIVEAVLFSAERPLTSKEIRQIFADAIDEETPGLTEPFRNVREAQLVAVLEELKIEYDVQQHSFQLVEIAGGWRLMSRAEYAPWLKKLLDEARPHRLSQPALETLSIIALRQPISRADIAAIRGVEVDGVIKSLLERDLITITGRSEQAGKPLLYGTTQRFLEHFGLRDIDDMPKSAELRAQAAALKTAEAKAAIVETPAAEPAPAAAVSASAEPAPVAPATSETDASATKSEEPAPTEEATETADAVDDEEEEDEYDEDDEDDDDDDDDDEAEDGEDKK